MNEIISVYRSLFGYYGPQGWWPLQCNASESGFDARGYHPGSYEFPVSRAEVWEILCGTILAQNTSWTNAEKSLTRLRMNGIASPEHLLGMTADGIASLIRPSGYFNQKSGRLRAFAAYFIGLGGVIPDRGELLALQGIGPETADSMLLYAWKQPHFVVDSYTARIMGRMGILDPDFSAIRSGKRYEHVQKIITKGLDELPAGKIPVFQEFHALLVRNATMHCASRPVCSGCPLEHSCEKRV
jgi:Uncharacterized protein related to Endonuclease III